MNISLENQQRFSRIANEIVSFVERPDGGAYQTPEYLKSVRGTYHSYLRDGMERARNDIRMLNEMVSPDLKSKYEDIPVAMRGRWLQEYLDWDPGTDPNGLVLLEKAAQAKDCLTSDRPLVEKQRIRENTMTGYKIILDHYRRLLNQ